MNFDLLPDTFLQLLFQNNLFTTQEALHLRAVCRRWKGAIEQVFIAKHLPLFCELQQYFGVDLKLACCTGGNENSAKDSLEDQVNKVEENEYDVHPKKANSRFIFIDYTNMYKY